MANDSASINIFMGRFFFQNYPVREKFIFKKLQAVIFKNNILDRSTNPTIYIVDVRYKFEIDYYRILNIPLVLIRINVDDRIKKKRGWKFDPKIDNDDSETNLDNYHNWDYIFENNTDGIDAVLKFVNEDLVIN